MINLPDLKLLGFLFFRNSRIFKQLVGEKTAKVPKMQIKLKTEPINGFRQGRFPVAIGG